MTDLAAKARHRYHTKLTKRLNDAQLAFEREEARGYKLQMGRAKYRLRLIEEEMRQFELSLEEEERRLNGDVEISTQSR